MAYVPESVPQMAVPSPNINVRRGLPRIDRQRPPSPGSDTEEEPRTSLRDVDSISIDSMESVPDGFGRRVTTFDNERTTIVYEAWELSLIKATYIRDSYKSIFGIKVATTWVHRNDGGVLNNPIVSFDQGELADMHEDAIHGFKHKRGCDQRMAYEQDLASRAYNLPAGIYDRLQQIVEDKTMTTNRNPYRKREWRVVVLQPGEFQMTELLPERKRTSIFSWKRQPPVTPTWFVVLRGEEVKSTKEDGGWKAFHRLSNPWWRLDQRETKDERDQHKKMMKKMDRADADRRHQLRRRPSPPPFGRIRPRPGAPPIGL
ncbi:hypothetical protein F5Y07DRAFT_395041 [Xylaria sp. FL0933]|nr:hypothetical protein F5Y07DRAFT_395041 [Xylaria sp. FL0933]